MVAQYPRNRVLVFRLTQAEYDSLKSACADRGGRNLSEFTRSELLHFLQGSSLERVMESRFTEIQRQVEELRQALLQLKLLLECRTAAGGGSQLSGD